MEEQTHEFRRTVLRQKMVPHSVTAMVFGIVSIAVMCYGGWVAAIVALALHSKAMKIYQENPPDYKESSLKMLRAAKICGIIGLIVSIVTTLFFLLYILVMVGVSNHYFHF
jgi:hypothetical protein